MVQGSTKLSPYTPPVKNLIFVTKILSTIWEKGGNLEGSGVTLFVVGSVSGVTDSPWVLFQVSPCLSSKDISRKRIV
jgi:hypothetical protein